MIEDEIEAARTTLALGDDEFRGVPEPEAKRIYEEAEKHFVGSQGRTRWWEDFLRKPASATFHDEQAYERITQLVPDTNALAYLIVLSDSGKLLLVYACTASAAERVLGECYAFEYYLVSSDWKWLICEDQNGVLMAIGEPAETRLRALAG